MLARFRLFVVLLAPGAIAQTRAIIISDIGNEPDDQMSLVRLLLYSKEIEIEGLIAATSTWQKNVTHPETMHKLVAAYGEVRKNLMLHAQGWPEAADLDARITSGQPGYGLASTGAGKSSAGSAAIVAAVTRAVVANDDPRPLWICLWGGANTLAQALIDLRATRPAAEVEKLVAKLRVDSISDQDDAGPWIRREFPSLFYIVQPSTPSGGEYYYATWTGISGDAYYRNGCGATMETVTNEWLEQNIRKGPLGKLYPKFLFIMEGDTPSFLGLIDNGLAAWQRPDFGGWGGRYVYRQPYGETHSIWTQGGDMFSRVTSQDTIRQDTIGEGCVSDQATISRGRRAFQNDFAARIDWTIADYAHANHNPVVEVNGQAGTAPVLIDAKVGEPITLDASHSRDPDGQKLDFQWFHYPEAGGTGTSLGAVTMSGADTPAAVVTATATCRPTWLPGRGCPATGTAHVILAVTDHGSPALTSYRRVILTIHAK